MSGGGIAAVVPVRNEVTTLPALVAALLSQTAPVDEVVIVDGGSVDGTTEMAVKLADDDPRVSVVVVGPTSPGRGRNIGIEATRAPWVLLIDAGMHPDNFLVERLLSKRNTDPECRVVIGSHRMQADTTWRAAAAVAVFQERESFEGRWCRFGLTPCLLERRVWVELGGFRDWRAAEDLDFLSRLDLLAVRKLRAPAAEAVWDLALNRRRLVRKWRVYAFHNAVQGTSWHRPAALWNLVGVGLASGAAVVIGWPGLLCFLGPHLTRTVARYRRHCLRGDDELDGGPAVFLQALLASLLVDASTLWGYLAFRLGRAPRDW